MTVERSFRKKFVCNELVVSAHLDVVGTVVGLGTEIVVVADLCVDVTVDLDLRADEVAEGDSIVEGVVEWTIELSLVCVEH